jgi:NitT/TauT family transport system permease protein
LVLKQTLYLIGPLFLLGVWGLVTQLDLISPLLLPAPHHVFEKAAALFIGGVILPDIYYTLYRAAGGYAIGIVLGTILGITTGLVASIHRSLEFVIDFGRSIPVITLYPLFMILFGIGDLSRMTTAAYPVMMIVLINTLYGVRNVKPVRKEVAKTKRLSLWRTLHWVIFPEALPQIVVGYRVSLSWAYLLAIVTEMFVGTYAGLGSRVSDAYVSYEVAELYATILTAGTVGYLLNKGFVLIEKRVIHWSDK